ncbi:tetraacyldisaccharide 4'-kinase [Rasiella rasia]|uniref:Tetraacyldisaccharide 4'-kinase n=1 Tax=Rasiella rasia TaxID=2744027 RepID=A0A6G6GPK6_9FLAO|nr:tetraacyldisaccharide 4'-kinase [Rasiella rasia]QIE60482.1 tetraacyldisaccharide 4'-kinase [Rasiella rasia]
MNLVRKLLFPFAVLYGWITGIRNFLYNKGILKSTEYKVPIVCVGNLSVGGTGKSPMIEYLISFLKEDYRIAVLSRGYKRATNGFIEVTELHNAREVGDEPLQFKTKFPDVTVAVCADRRTGIEHLQEKADVILLDDAFQHRKVKAAVNILLTPFHDLFMDDWMLPTGNLREPRRGSKRTQCLVVTKCPPSVAYAKLQEIELRMPIYNHQKLYFSGINYAETMHGAKESQPLLYLKDKPFTLVTGIADPSPLVTYLTEQGYTFTHEKFPDHHNFSDAEIAALRQKELILTTEKDFMRLQHRVEKYAMYYVPITTVILKEQAEFFEDFIIKSIDKKRLG